MKKHLGFFFPDFDDGMFRFIVRGPDGQGAYQREKRVPAVALCHDPGHHIAIDVGAHVGLWSKYLIGDFLQVHAFECNPPVIECFKANLKEALEFEQVILHETALGNTIGRAEVMTEISNSGASCAVATEDEDSDPQNVPMTRLDEFGFKDVGFIKIDVEGGELFVIQGAEQTIRQNKPVIIVEQKEKYFGLLGVDPLSAVRLLQDWGYRIVHNITGDYIMVFDE
jgi:FkbM family methyltransferase